MLIFCTAIDVASGKYGPVVDELNLAVQSFHGSEKQSQCINKDTLGITARICCTDI